MNNESEIEQVELSIEHARKSVGNMKALRSLTKNKEFVSVILEGYFKEEASRLVLLKGDPAMEQYLLSIDKQINAIGQFRQYLSTIMALGNQAERAMKDDEQTREELLAEGLQ